MACLATIALVLPAGAVAEPPEPVTTIATNTAVAATGSLRPGSTFHPLGPVRILDSRTGEGGASVLRADVPQSFQIGGLYGVPADATAVTGMFTIANPSHSGWVSVTPVAQTAASNTTSTVNFTTTDPRASGVTMPLGGDGKIWALYHSGRSADTVDVIFDLSGYFSVDPAGSTFHLLGPARILDSRSGTGGAAALASDVPESFQIGGQFGVPADATAVTGMFTIASPTHSGWVSITPVERTTESTTTSTVNFTTTDPRASGVTMPLGSDGKMWALYHGGAATDTVAVIFDVSGYFSVDPAGYLFHPLGPSRLFDSRSGAGGARPLHADAPQSLQLGGQFGMPAGVTAVTGMFTIASPTHSGWVSVTPVRQTAATNTTSTVNFTTTDPRASGLTMPLGSDGKLWALYHGGSAATTVAVIFDVSGYFCADPPALHAMPMYFRGWLPDDGATKDANGVVMVNYGGSTGLQYNPTSIAQAAIGFYNRWQFVSTSPDQQAADRLAFFAQIKWLADNQTGDGRWLYHFHWGSQVVPWWSAMAEGVAMSALLRAYSVTGDTSYLTVIARARSTFERDQKHTGVDSSLTYGGKINVVYQEYMPGYNQNVLNGWMFAIVGLWEDGVYLEDPMAMFDATAADRGVHAVQTLLPLYDTGSWSYYNLNSLTAASRGPLAGLTYHKIHIAELQFLGTVTGNPVLTGYAGRFQAYLDSCTARGTCP